MGFKGSKKNTPYAAQMASEECSRVAYDLGLRKVKVFVKGPGSGRESAIRAILLINRPNMSFNRNKRILPTMLTVASRYPYRARTLISSGSPYSGIILKRADLPILKGTSFPDLGFFIKTE